MTAKVKAYRIFRTALVATCIALATGSPLPASGSSGAVDLSPIAADAPLIIGLGESSHGEPASLAARNRLVRTLIEQGRTRLLLFESGYPESRKLNQFVHGDGGSAADIALVGFSNGFGSLPANVELIDFVRSFNTRQPTDKQVGIAGIDLSLGGPLGSAPSMAPVECALEGIEHQQADRVRQLFEIATRPGLTGAPVSLGVIKQYRDALAQLDRAIPGNRTFETELCRKLVHQGLTLLRSIPELTPTGKLLPSAWRSIEGRDRAMAANAKTLTQMFGNDRPSVLLAHLTHIAASPMYGPRWAGLNRAPSSMGDQLRRDLGNRYTAVLMVNRLNRAGKEIACSNGPPLSTYAKNSLIRVVPPTRWVEVPVNGSDCQLLPLPRAANFLFAP